MRKPSLVAAGCSLSGGEYFSSLLGNSMNINISLVVSIVSVVIALFSLREARRISRFTKISLQQQSYEAAKTLPALNALGIVKIGGKTRAKLIIFNQRNVPCKVECVKCYSYDPKPRSLSNWIRSQFEPFDWDYSREEGFWNPKGILDDDEYYAGEALPFTLVKDKEILLVTLSDFTPRKKYKFEVITSQGIATYIGILPSATTSLPHEHFRTLTY
jgi:hypothetical protein